MPAPPALRHLPLALVVLLLGALAAAQQPLPREALRAWVLAPLDTSRLEAPPALVGRFADQAAVEKTAAALLAQRRATGYRRIAVPDRDPDQASAALLLPRRTDREAGPPLLVVSEPGHGQYPPDELPLRALYAGWLEAGWGILAPRTSAFGPTGRPGPDLAALLALARMTAPYDTERVVLMSSLAPATSARSAVTRGYSGETTAFCALQEVLPGAGLPDRVLDLDAWSGRLVLVHMSRHNPVEASLHVNELRARQRAGRLRVLSNRDPALDWAGQLVLGPGAARTLEAAARRSAPATRLEFTAGGLGARRHEWLELPTLDAPLRIAAWIEKELLEVHTPDVPAREPFPMNVYLPADASIRAVRLNGRPLGVPQATEDVQAALLLARYTLQTGRRAGSVLRVR